MGETSTGCKGYCCYREPEGDHCPARPYGQRAILKFAQYNGAHPIAGRHTPGTFTNQLQTSFGEPLLIILTDPRTDHQVDQFFYRDTEEAKEHEEEEVVAATDYGATDFSTAAICLAADQWSGQISDAQWGAEVPAAAVPSVRWDPEV